MKKDLKIVVLGLIFLLFLGACSSSVDELNGSYKIDNDFAKVELEIDGEDALMSLSGQAMNGTVDRAKKTITFKDGKETEKFEYKIVGSKLSLTNDGDTLGFEKVTDNKKTKSSKKTKNSSNQADFSQEDSAVSSSTDDSEYIYEDYFSLATGEYEVGTDVKPGSYNVDFSYFDFSDEEKEDGQGYIEIIRDGNTKKYDFPNDGAEQRIILKKGDMIICTPENTDSEFTFSIDEGY